MERITPSNVGEKLNDALRISDQERNSILFEMGNRYFEDYAGGDEEFRRNITTGETGRMLWSWFSNQFYMAANEYLGVLSFMKCDTATARRIFHDVVPRKLSSFYPPYAIIKRFIKPNNSNYGRNTRRKAEEVPCMAGRSRQ